MRSQYYDIRPVFFIAPQPVSATSLFLADTGGKVDDILHFPFSWSVLNWKSRKRTRQAIARLASYFQREFRYDFRQYSAGENADPRDRVWYYVHRAAGFDGPMLGAAVFRWREYRNEPHGLALAWVWLHPYIRRSGVLSSVWPFWRKMYGDFHVEGPISSSMRAFLAKVDAPGENLRWVNIEDEDVRAESRRRCLPDRRIGREVHRHRSRGPQPGPVLVVRVHRGRIRARRREDVLLGRRRPCGQADRSWPARLDDRDRRMGEVR